MILYYFPLCPFSRKVRALLKEKKLSCDLIYENPWEKRNEFMKINPTGQKILLISIYEFLVEIEELINDNDWQGITTVVGNLTHPEFKPWLNRLNSFIIAYRNISTIYRYLLQYIS